MGNYLFKVHDLLEVQQTVDWHLFQVVELLDQQNVQHSSVNLVHFSWVKDNKDVEKNADNKDNEDINRIAPYGTVITTPITIWVGVLPDTLTSEEAFHSSNDVLKLKEHSIFDVDVAYCELVARVFSGPRLLMPALDSDPLKAVINPLTTTLSLPIAGLKTLECQGTTEFYSSVGKVLYAITAHHILFPKDNDNSSYFYVSIFIPLRIWVQFWVYLHSQT